MNPHEIAEAFNYHFATIGPELASVMRSENTDDALQDSSAEIPSVIPPLVFQVIDENLVKTEINRLKSAKSPGHDKLPVQVIKDAVEILSRSLAKVSTLPEQRIFPDIWKLEWKLQFQSRPTIWLV